MITAGTSIKYQTSLPNTDKNVLVFISAKLTKYTPAKMVIGAKLSKYTSDARYL